MKKFVVLIIFFIEPTFAQEQFLKDCESHSMREVLQYSLKTSSCKETAISISEKKSFSEIIYPEFIKKNRKLLAYPWTDEFPYLYGFNKQIMNNEYSNPVSVGGEDYGDLDLFKDFKNLTDISYLPEYKYYKGAKGVCKILKRFPNLKTITVEGQFLLNPIADSCLSQKKSVEVIIRDEFKGYKFTPKTKIIGIENFIGNYEDLLPFTHLKYLGISNSASTLKGIETLYSLSRLTHLSINFKHNVSDIYKTGNFKNLRYLNLTCAENEKLNSPFSTSCAGGSDFSDLTFIPKLQWLEHLNLSFNSISDINPIKALHHLRYLKLKGNKISSIPDLNELKSLNYIDLSGNSLINLSNIETLNNISFLNLSGNKIQDFTSISKLDKIKYLNISNNPQPTLNHLFIPPPTLKVLNMNGGGGSPSIDTFEFGLRRMPLKTFLNEHDLLLEALFHDFNVSSKEAERQNCGTYPIVENSLNLSHFREIEVLTLKNNNLTLLPKDIKALSHLLYLNIERNMIHYLKPNSLPSSLETLQMSHNKFAVFPDLSSLKMLEKVDISSNDLTEIENIKKLPESISELILSNNLISNLEAMTTLFPKEKFTFFSAVIELSGNPVLRNHQNCPVVTASYLENICKEYILEKKDNLLDQGLSSFKYYDNMQTWHEGRKCGFTSLDI